MYEVRRSDLGPIMEASCIWTHLDQRSKTFKKLKYNYSNESKRTNTRNHICPLSSMADY